MARATETVATALADDAALATAIQVLAQNPQAPHLDGVALSAAALLGAANGSANG
jgi:hypothetical protein